LKPFDHLDNFNLELVGSNDRTVNGGVKRGRVIAGSENSDPFHAAAQANEADCVRNSVASSHRAALLAGLSQAELTALYACATGAMPTSTVRLRTQPTGQLCQNQCLCQLLKEKCGAS